MDIEEVDLISFFECEPSKIDDDNKVPFYYNFSTFEYTNERQDRVVFSICPAYREVRLDIISLTCKTEMTMNNVTEINIQNDTKNLADTIIRTDNLEVYLAIKPNVTIRIIENSNK